MLKAVAEEIKTSDYSCGARPNRTKKETSAQQRQAVNTAMQQIIRLLPPKPRWFPWHPPGEPSWPYFSRVKHIVIGASILLTVAGGRCRSPEGAASVPKPHDVLSLRDL